MEEIVVGPVAVKVVESLFTLIGRHVGYVWNYRTNISDVTRQIEKLRDDRFRVQQSVDEANIEGDEIFPFVQEWLSRAEEMIKETDKFIADEREANRGCFHLKLRYQHSEKAKKQAAGIVIEIQEADNLIKKGVAHRPPPPGIGLSSVSGTYEVLRSRETVLDKIMEALRDDAIRMIGVWGMGGVGKTTLVQQVAKRAQVAKQTNEEKLFDTVVMALNISQTPNVTKIQGEIASILGLKLGQTNESERAVRLSQSLKKHKRILVILDDLWEPIEFETIGIPYASEDHPKGYCKVLLTSRKHDLLCKDMGTHKDIHIQHLCAEEAWSLFKKTVGDSVKKLEVQPIATEIVKKCEGLPVAILTIAKVLKGENEVGVWRNTLEELRRSEPTNIGGVNKNVYSCLKLSYNHLESIEVKSLFLLCGLLGYGDISMEDLLKYVMGFDLFGYMDSLEKARDKLVTLVKILKASSLLLDAIVVEDAQIFSEPPSLYFVEEGNRHVRMHDVISDVAKSIASKDPHRFVVVNQDVTLQEWEKRGAELRNCTAMSLKCRDVQELPEGLVCPKLEFFSLDSNGNDNSLKIPDTFFEEMKEVKVLSLSGVDLSQPPSSLHFLSNLRILCLQRYWSTDSTFENIAVLLGELKKLQILSLVGYGAVEFPKEMMQLSDLRMLSLRDCLVFIPRNVISSLSRLEHLCVKDIIYYDGEEEEYGGMHAWVYELKRLSCLRSLEIEISYPDVLQEEVSFDNLTRYDICIGCQRDAFDDERNSSRRLKLVGVNGQHLVKCFSKPLKIVEVLDLSRLTEIKHFVNELDCDGFLHLKYLSVYWSDMMQYIVNTMEMEMERVDHLPPTAFPLLEELNLRELPELEALCHGPVLMGCFANLRILKIVECHSLKSILWIPTPTTQGRESVLVFPQLQHLELQSLRDLIDFYSTRISGSEDPSIIPFFSQQVAFPKLEFLSLKSIDNVRTMWHNQYPVGLCCKLLKELRLRGCENLQTVFPTSVVKGLMQLEVLKVSDCGVEEIVAANANGLEAVPIFLFPKLTSLKLSKLRRLKRFYQGMYTLGCPLLKKLEVYKCDNLELLFQDKSLQDEVDRQPLFLVDKDTFPNMEELVLSLKDPMEIWQGQYSRKLLGKLRVLEIKECHDISVAIPSSKLQALHNLKQLTLRSCNSVEKVIQVEGFVGETVLPQLTTMYLEDLLMLKHLSGFGLEPILQNLNSLHVSQCGNLINLVSSSMAKRLVRLKKLSITNCSMVKEIVGEDDICFTEFEKPQLEHLVNVKSFSSANNILEFPSLEEMEVKKLPGLTHLYKKIPGILVHQNLQKLRILEISDCGDLEILLTLSMAKTLVQLERLIVKECDRMKEIVENEGGESTDDEIIFTKLQDLELRSLPNLKSFCSARYTFRFPCLTDMWVTECPAKEFFSKGHSITPRLERVKKGYNLSYWENDLNATIHKMFMEEEDLEEWDIKEKVSDEEDAQEGDSEEQHPKVEDSMEEDTKEEDSEEGSGSP